MSGPLQPATNREKLSDLPGYVSFFQFLRNFRQRNAFEQAELILQAALDPVIASRAKKGEFVKCFDHFDLLQTARSRTCWLLILFRDFPLAA